VFLIEEITVSAGTYIDINSDFYSYSTVGVLLLP